MRDIFRELSRQLYVYCGGDERVLVREALATVHPAIDYVDDMAPSDRLLHLHDLAQIKNNKAFIDTVGFLVTAQMDLIAKRATLDTLPFARGTLNGLSLVVEELGRAESRLAREKVSNEFDKFNAL